MSRKSSIFITKAMFFEAYTPKHKPIFVSGRDFYSLTYRYSGKTSIVSGEAELISESDSVTFMPKGLSYTTEILEDVHMAVVHFDFECEQPPLVPAVIDAENTAVRSLFKALMKNGTDTSADLSKMSIFYEILATLDSQGMLASQRDIPVKIKRAREIIDGNFCDPYFSVTELADGIGVSASYLRREFCAAFGLSPISYLKDLRVEKAKRLLLSEQYPISQIAAECGYAGASYFIQDFHRSTGESPGYYRKRLLDSP